MEKTKNGKINMNAKLKVIGFNDKIPKGWRLLELWEAKAMKQKVHDVCKSHGAWYIVAFAQGKIDGVGYGNKIHDSYGKECGQRMIIEDIIEEKEYVKEKENEYVKAKEYEYIEEKDYIEEKELKNNDDNDDEIISPPGNFQ